MGNAESKKDKLERYEHYFKYFKRFLKEHGQYKFIMSYLFFGNRTKNEFLHAWMKEDAKDALTMISVIGKGYEVNGGYGYWLKHVHHISYLWFEECMRLKLF